MLVNDSLDVARGNVIDSHFPYLFTKMRPETYPPIYPPGHSWEHIGIDIFLFSTPFDKGTIIPYPRKYLIYEKWYLLSKKSNSLLTVITITIEIL